MELILVLAAMIAVGLLMGWIAGFIWRESRPVGLPGDYVVAVISAVVVGLMDWYLIPAMGFSDTLKYVGIAVEPALSALLVLWVIKKAKS